MNIAAYTGGKHNPSSRFRVGQYISLLRDFGCKVSHFDAPFGAFPPPERWKRPWWGLASLTCRVTQIALSYRHDLVWMQREMLSTFSIGTFYTEARVFDVDDAIGCTGAVSLQVVWLINVILLSVAINFLQNTSPGGIPM
jgi:hypothetical protein